MGWKSLYALRLRALLCGAEKQYGGLSEKHQFLGSCECGDLGETGLKTNQGVNVSSQLL